MHFYSRTYCLFKTLSDEILPGNHATDLGKKRSLKQADMATALHTGRIDAASIWNPLFIQRQLERESGDKGGHICFLQGGIRYIVQSLTGAVVATSHLDGCGSGDGLAQSDAILEILGIDPFAPVDRKLADMGDHGGPAEGRRTQPQE
jgi:hypothetical protein